MKFRSKLTSVCIAALAGVSMSGQSAHAAGFYLQEQSAVAMGSAFAGASALARNASILYHNPAAMTDLDGGQFSVNADYLYPEADFTDKGSTTVGGGFINGVDSNDPTPSVILGNAYLAYPVWEEELWLGIGFSTPFGLSTQYHANWFGRLDSTESALETYDVQPSFAWQVNNWLSVGGGVNVQYIDAELVAQVTDTLSFGRSKLTGSDWSLGWNAGVLIEPNEQTNIGVHYRSKIYHKLDGRILVTGLVVPGQSIDTGGNADADLPDILSFGISHELTDSWTLLAQANWFGWSSFKDLTVFLDTGALASTVEQNFEDTMSFAFGAEYSWSDELTLRFGYQYDETPTVDEFRTTRIPDGDRHNFGAGMSYDLSDNIVFNFSGLLSLMEAAPISLNRNPAGVPAGIRVEVEKEPSSTAILSAGISYRF